MIQLKQAYLGVRYTKLSRVANSSTCHHQRGRINFSFFMSYYWQCANLSLSLLRLRAYIKRIRMPPTHCSCYFSVLLVFSRKHRYLFRIKKMLEMNPCPEAILQLSQVKYLIFHYYSNQQCQCAF